MRQADLLTNDQVVELVERLSDAFKVARPEVTFDLPDMWHENVRIEGRYFALERRIAFPGPPYVLHDIKSVAHEVAHHIDHGRLLEGVGGHDDHHDQVSIDCLALAIDWIDKRQISGATC